MRLSLCLTLCLQSARMLPQRSDDNESSNRRDTRDMGHDSG
jgi:hypothetical protein